jgi:Kef-type K+ transport system membrane component KefB
LAVQDLLASPAFQMSVLLFVALGGYLIAYRINQSAVVGIILAGILVGPSLLGLVTYTDFVSSLATLGAIVLLFTIGLEFEVKEIAKLKYFIIALLGVIVPWAGGYFLSKAFGYDFKAAVFIGTALTATSIAVTANVLREMGKLQTDAAKAIIGAAVVDDILALLALSLAESLVSGSIKLLPILLITAKAIGFIAIGIFVVKTPLNKMLSGLDKSKLAAKYPESIFIFAMMVAFLYSITAELVGLSAIVGAFLAGASFDAAHLKRAAIFKEGAEHLQIIFASIFFISLGVLMDLRVVTASLLVFVFALTVVAILTKVIGCGGAAKILGLDIRNSFIVGVGMVPQLITQSTYSALILMALLTTVIPPIILRNWLFKERREKKQALTPP